MKNKEEKKAELIAKIIFYIMGIITIIACILILGCTNTMIETMSIPKDGLIMCLASLGWFGVLALIIKYIKS